MISIQFFFSVIYSLPGRKRKKNSMENKSERFKSSETETESRREAFFLFKEGVDNSDKSASNGRGKKIIDTKESSCQTKLDEILRRQMEEFEEELEQVRETMEKECAEEKEDFEMRVRYEYNEIIKAKDELTRVLTEEKDFFRNELSEPRRSFDLFTRHVHRDRCSPSPGLAKREPNP